MIVTAMLRKSADLALAVRAANEALARALRDADVREIRKCPRDADTSEGVADTGKG